jgi:hypothetical protein
MTTHQVAGELYLVLCMSSGRAGFEVATRRIFSTLPEANAYLATINPSWRPVVAQIVSPLEVDRCSGCGAAMERGYRCPRECGDK